MPSENPHKQELSLRATGAMFGLLRPSLRVHAEDEEPQHQQSFREDAAATPDRGVPRERQPHSTESATTDYLVC